MRQIFVAGNWKMNGSLEANQQLIDGIKAGVSAGINSEVAVCPPAVYLPQIADLLAGSDISWGGQDLCEQASGAYTGQISAAMLLEMKCKYVIVGHSERRTLNGESDQLVAEKYAAALSAGLKPILCIGELLEERESGDTEAVVARQLNAVLDNVGIEGIGAGVIAYEPVWAIGTGKTASPEQAQDVHAFIRQTVEGKYNQELAQHVSILYGGSVKPNNAKEIFSKPDVDGGLIGGAALNAEDFYAIVNAF